ncbi:MAG: hypothetical protein FJX52_05770 [Alphaproteobacteria bacterium]|nr:hypothetical protein [Alphaproteobacteria bacterium]
MLQAMQDVEGGFVHMTPHFARNIIPPARYRDTLSRTWLCPAPRGDRTWDTFRLYEGLEMGCLPIVERADGYYRRLLGDHALIEAKDWPDAARIARELLADRPKLEMRRRACEEWWHNFKINLAGDIAAFIRGRLTEPHSPGPLDQLESCHSD